MELIKEVGIVYGEGRYPFSYAQCAWDPEGWCSVIDNLPLKYDMCFVDLEKKPYRKNLSAWWNGRVWEGLRLKSTDKVVRWKIYSHIL